jgi:hypothetical protein
MSDGGQSQVPHNRFASDLCVEKWAFHRANEGGFG